MATPVIAYTGPGLPENVAQGPQATRPAAPSRLASGRAVGFVKAHALTAAFHPGVMSGPGGVALGSTRAKRVAVALTTFPAIYRRFMTGEVVTPKLAVMREYPPIIR